MINSGKGRGLMNKVKIVMYLIVVAIGVLIVMIGRQLCG